jgi:antitoxin (DNA-binding transcriptional repressor) of toxin-antitoxin stability system
MYHMKTATVRELRNEFPRIEAWVHEGESVNITKRGKVIGTLVPASANAGISNRVAKPDIMARLRETWGERVFSLEEVAAMREDEQAGDLG